MPDITMCASDTCHRRTECYRHEASGTEPNPHRQAYFISSEIDKDNCEYFAPQHTKKYANSTQEPS